MRKYEIMYILSPKLDENDIKKITTNINSIFTKEGKILVSEIESELKNLAYSIQKFDRGFYNNLVVETNQKTINEFNRIANITEEIIRFIVLKKEDK
ncbi:30S ribosomal protein S6 [Candidatus Phytoplasma phoenicium]|uniref:Small ribosomal subunit protein bS6 n=1 Tax=Candidatus Phytoplasma phoenicium TaxID=198422 RepID=A0A2S8NUX1_9MOLU|nr:30S ribosomal protein S6 [Candidatus Phytoplasma phoenicium]